MEQAIDVLHITKPKASGSSRANSVIPQESGGNSKGALTDLEEDVAQITPVMCLSHLSLSST